MDGWNVCCVLCCCNSLYDLVCILSLSHLCRSCWALKLSSQLEFVSYMCYLYFRMDVLLWFSHCDLLFIFSDAASGNDRSVVIL